ncbi:hypothetical protein FHW79_000515 [Azospirillum sp. OGB3]|uniref:hypothetical protein n=1 Tax=Azospirillum sp. OGB3 TaxID=2587012 RepID=UPI001606AEE1|nr:hypothetical protein [Azospirillum sp. OGB3]MBB3262928.1 hypothetical protein [Azospirillum sp. OGB3]
MGGPRITINHLWRRVDRAMVVAHHASTDISRRYERVSRGDNVIDKNLMLRMIEGAALRNVNFSCNDCKEVADDCIVYFGPGITYSKLRVPEFDEIPTNRSGDIDVLEIIKNINGSIYILNECVLFLKDIRTRLDSIAERPEKFQRHQLVDRNFNLHPKP